jgi:hypothetical protein
MKKKYIKLQMHLTNIDYKAPIFVPNSLTVNPKGEPTTPLSKGYNGGFEGNPWADNDNSQISNNNPWKD